MTDDSGKSGEARREITVFGELVQPVADFTVAPSRVVAGQSVLFDASRSTLLAPALTNEARGSGQRTIA